LKAYNPIGENICALQANAILCRSIARTRKIMSINGIEIRALREKVAGSHSFT